MATATRRPAVRAPHGTARLTLFINGTAYSVRPIRPDDPDVARAFRIRKGGSEAYTVAVTRYGPTCECGDWTWRKDGTGIPCKHIAACRAVGLLD